MEPLVDREKVLGDDMIVGEGGADGGHRAPGETALVRRKRKAKRSIHVARGFIVFHVVLVAFPLLVITLWAFSNAWPWPDLWPQELTTRGIEVALSGRQNAGFDTLLLSVGIALAVALVSTLVAGLAARAICQFDWRGKQVFQFSTLLPFLIPSTVFAMGVQVVFLRLGLGRTITGVVLAHSIVALPYAVTIMVDITRAAGVKHEEAARSLGATTFQMVKNVTLPQLMPGILSSISMCYIMSFSQYFLTLLVGGGKVRTFVLVLFPYLSGGDRTIACAYGLIFIVMTFTVFLIFEFLLKKFGIREEQNLFQL